MDWLEIMKLNLDNLEACSRYDIVHIKWKDIVADSSWLSATEIEGTKLADVSSVGFYMMSDHSVVRISAMFDFAEDTGDVTVIPISCISEVKLLSEV